MFRLHLLLMIALLAMLVTPTRSTQHECKDPNKTEIIYQGDGEGLPEIYDTLVACPNITSLDLDMTLTGCVVGPEPWHFQFEEGDRFPMLQKLSLSGYDFNGTRDPFAHWYYGTPWYKRAMDSIFASASSVKSPFLRQNKTDEVKIEPRKVATQTNFSSISQLHLGQDQTFFYERMTGEFPNVTRASFDWMNTGEHVPQEKIGFISSLDSLESLKISIDTPYPYGSKSKSRTRFPLEIFGQAQVVSTIRSLALTQTESSLIDLRRPMLDVAEITKIRDACPGLSEFTLDIDRDAEIGWPNETFATLQQMHNLTDLHLRLEIGADLHAGEQGEYYFNDEGISGDSALREPRMNKSVAESLFADLQAGKVGKPLALVSFEVGDYSEGGYVGPLYYPSWEEGRARKFICSEQDTSKICRVLGERDIYEDLPHDEL